MTEQPQASTEAEPEGGGEKEGAAGDEDVDGEADAEDSDAESEPEEESCCNKVHLFEILRQARQFFHNISNVQPLIGSCTLCCFLGMVCAFLAKGKKGASRVQFVHFGLSPVFSDFLFQGKGGSRAMKAKRAREERERGGRARRGRRR